MTRPPGPPRSPQGSQPFVLEGLVAQQAELHLVGRPGVLRVVLEARPLEVLHRVGAPAAVGVPLVQLLGDGVAEHVQARPGPASSAGSPGTGCAPSPGSTPASPRPGKGAARREGAPRAPSAGRPAGRAAPRRASRRAPGGTRTAPAGSTAPCTPPPASPPCGDSRRGRARRRRRRSAGRRSPGCVRWPRRRSLRGGRGGRRGRSAGATGTGTGAGAADGAAPGGRDRLGPARRGGAGAAGSVRRLTHRRSPKAPPSGACSCHSPRSVAPGVLRRRPGGAR